MDAMFEGKTMWVFRDKDLTRVHPRRDTINVAQEETLSEKLDGKADHLEEA